MAYYKKQEIINYVRENIKQLESRGLNSLNPESEVLMKLENEEDLVGFFWINYEEGESDGEKIKLDGKSFFRVDHDIYTDDRFAIDLYQAMKMGVNASDIIRKREQDKEIAKQSVVNTSIIELENKLKQNTGKDGTEGIGEVKGLQ